MKKLPLIRHVRYFWNSFWLAMWVSRCSQLGIGYFAQPSDLKYLQGIWDGKH